MKQDILKEENVFIKKSFKNREEALEFFSDHLLNKGKVSSDFKKALLKREEEFPTGLQIDNINVAVPHADHIYVRESEILLCTLENPILFQRMDNPDEGVKVSIIILMAINNPDAHIEVLKKIFSLIQDQLILKRVFAENSKKKISEIFN